MRGAGAELNGEPLRASDCSRLAEAIVGLSFNPSVQAKRDMAQILPALLPVVGDIRRVPAAMNLVYLAAGRFDAGLLVHTKLWDIAAGLLVAAEAGVILSGPDGAPPRTHPGRLSGAMARVLRGSGGLGDRLGPSPLTISPHPPTPRTTREDRSTSAIRRGHRFTMTMPRTTTVAANTRPTPKRSRKNTVPMTAPKTMLVSRNAATAAVAPLVWATSTSP